MTETTGRDAGAREAGLEKPGDDEIDLFRVVAFIRDHWTKFIASAVLGAVIGIGYAFIVPRESDLTLLNRDAFDFVSWRVYSSRLLPDLVSQAIKAGEGEAGNDRFLKSLATPAWWAANVQSVLSVSKADVRDMPTVSKDLQDAAALIRQLVIKTHGSDASEAFKNAQTAESVLRNGIAYLSLTDLLTHYEQDISTKPATLKAKITKSELELGFLAQRAANLEQLMRRYPEGKTGIVMQGVVQPNDAAAKYLPLVTQVIATKTEIDQANEDIARAKDDLARVSIYERFVAEARRVSEKKMNGLKAVEDLLTFEQKMRTSIDASDVRLLYALDTIRGDLTKIRARATVSLVQASEPVLVPRSFIKPTAIGAIGALFLAIALYVLLDLWQAVMRSERAEAPGQG